MKPFDFLLLLHRFEFSIFQRKLLIAILSRIEIGKKNSLTFQFKARELMTDIEPKMTYEQLQAEMLQLTNRTYEIEEAKFLLFASLLSNTTFLKGTGIIRVALNKAMLPYLVILKKTYSLKTIQHLLSFKSTYSKKIYLVLNKKPHGTSIKWNVEDFKQYLNNNYQDYNTFKKRVLLQAQKELHRTDMAFTFEEEKIGRKVENLTLKTMQIAQSYLHQSEIPLIKKLTKQLEVTKEQAHKIVVKFTPEEIHLISYQILEKHRSGQIKTSLGAYSVGVFNNYLK